MFDDLRVVVCASDQNVGEGLVVTQQHVVARHQALDQIRFQQQRLDLGVSRGHLQRHGFGDHALQAAWQLGELRVGGDAPLEAARLADIKRIAPGVEHAVDAGAWRQRLDRTRQNLDALGQTAFESLHRRLTQPYVVGRLLFQARQARRGGRLPIDGRLLRCALAPESRILRNGLAGAPAHWFTNR